MTDWLEEIKAREAKAPRDFDLKKKYILDLREARSEDEEFAYHAFDDIPRLVAEVDRLRQENAELRTDAEQLRGELEFARAVLAEAHEANRQLKAALKGGE